MSGSDPVAVAREFVRQEFPRTEPQQIVANHLDAAILLGSAVHSDLPEPNDLDVMLYVPESTEEHFDIPPIHEMEYKGYEIELCVMSTERLARAARRKDDPRTYWECEILYARTDRIRRMIERARTMTEKDQRAFVWTAYCQFELNRQATDGYSDRLTPSLRDSQNVFLYARAKLATEGLYHPLKWLGPRLKKLDPEGFERAVSQDMDWLRSDFQTCLESLGFTHEEIEDWDRTNLGLLMFQKN